jgi:hypothetical protein
MRVEGAIQPDGDGSGLNREAWCQLVARRPEFRRPEPRQGINPFTREPMIVRPTPDAAEVVVDGVSVGDVGWSMSEDVPQVNVSVERSAVPLVLQWATELGGEFHEESCPSDADA